jgi:hypothetical protein
MTQALYADMNNKTIKNKNKNKKEGQLWLMLAADLCIIYLRS